ncbi:MAG TPA: ABC transporter substrate-binding protein [Stellaceae bacterium]|nr:ABC transporter substrate-binding protein [Stellaceae bacterium]
MSGVARILGGGAAVSLSLAILLSAAPHAAAQTRAETLRQVTGNTVNTLDPTVPGSTREAFGMSMNVYDRLVTFERKANGKGFIFDFDHMRPELAKSFDISPDGLTITFHLRPDATWHDGTPVTAEDVKWSLDRAVTAKSLGPPQMLTGSLTSASQFTIIDPMTVQVKLDKPDRLALPNLATVYAIMVNSKVAKAHVTEDDPWALQWLKEHEAGSGAYVVDVFKPGEQIVLHRNEAWKGGKDGTLPFFKRIIAQTVPEAATRANLLARGDADIAIDLQSSDVPEIEKSGKLKVVSTPQFNAFTVVAFNTRIPPYDNVKVRRAIAAALPYEDMFKAAIFGRGAKLYGADWTTTPPDGKFPQPMPEHTDLVAAKKLLTEAGFAEGFDTTFSYSVSTAQINDPLAALLKESLGKIGIRVEIQKLPDAQMSTLVTEKKVAMFTDTPISWMTSTDYFFRNFFTGDQRWNYSSWDNQDVVATAQTARFEPDPVKYEALAKKLVAITADQVPEAFLWQPSQDAVMGPTVDGYTYWFHRQVDYRDLKRQ